jgi:hypothetical protein
MRAVLATAVAALAVAAPAAALSIPKDASLSLARAAGQTRTADTAKSCQAGSRKKVILKSGHPQVVACEQPPKSNLLSPSSAAKATAAALGVLG